MASVTLGGNPVTVNGDLPKKGETVADFTLTGNVVTLSTARNHEFHAKFGVDIADGPLRGLTARAVVVLDENNRVLHSQLVPEIRTEPDYSAALAALN